MKEIQNITLDEIKRIRREVSWSEGEKLLKDFHKHKKKCKKRLMKEIKNQDNKVLRFQKRVHGECYYCQEKAIIHTNYCKKCTLKKKTYGTHIDFCTVCNIETRHSNGWNRCKICKTKNTGEKK